MHEVCLRPEDEETAVAACAVGLCVSRDRGATWTLDRPTSDVTHCSAVAFSGEAIFVSVSDGPFASHATVLRRSIDGSESLRSVGGGLPNRLDGIVDTGCIASKGPQFGVVDRGGNVYASEDAGRHWSRLTQGIPDASSVLIV